MFKKISRAPGLGLLWSLSSHLTNTCNKSKYSAYIQKLINVPSFWAWFLYAACTTDCSRCSQKMSKFTWTSLYVPRRFSIFQFSDITRDPKNIDFFEAKYSINIWLFLPKYLVKYLIFHKILIFPKNIDF